MPVRPPGVGGNPRRTCSKRCRNQKNRAAVNARAPGSVAAMRREAYALAVEADLTPQTARSFWSPRSFMKFIELAGDLLRANPVGPEEPTALGRPESAVGDGQAGQDESL